MTREIRFDVSKEIKERHLKLVELLGRRKGELAFTLYLSGLELMERELSAGKFPIFLPVKNQKSVLRFKFEKGLNIE